eukprot:1158930-Pelagomonas_calceolata.AAC.4
MAAAWFALIFRVEEAPGSSLAAGADACDVAAADSAGDVSFADAAADGGAAGVSDGGAADSNAGAAADGVAVGASDAAPCDDDGSDDGAAWLCEGMLAVAELAGANILPCNKRNIGAFSKMEQ